MVLQEISRKDRLESITPTILEKFENAEHLVGYSDHEGDEYETNTFTYEEDGWFFDIYYRCCGKWDISPGDYWTPPTHDLVSTWGDVLEITASYTDEESDEEIEFTEDELSELKAELEKIIESITG